MLSRKCFKFHFAVTMYPPSLKMKDQAYEWGRFRNTGSNTHTIITRKKLTPPPPPPTHLPEGTTNEYKQHNIVFIEK